MRWAQVSQRRLVLCWLGYSALGCPSRPLSESGKQPSGASGASAASTASAASPALLIVNADPGAFTLRAARALEVLTVARIERRNADGSWTEALSANGAPGYQLNETCSAVPSPPCRSLSAGETLVPVPWTGDDCGAQCGQPCEPEEHYQSGPHRLVVTACAAPHERFEGAAFEMPATSQALARLRAASDVEQVRAVRLDSRNFRFTPGVIEPGRIGGLKEISGTTQELSPELTVELLQWLRAETGFNDHVQGRCVAGLSVGFVLTHKPVAGTRQRTELSVDADCRSLGIYRNGEDISGTHFDPSRERFFDIFRRVFPNDQRLRRALERISDSFPHEKKR